MKISKSFNFDINNHKCMSKIFKFLILKSATVEGEGKFHYLLRAVLVYTGGEVRVVSSEQYMSSDSKSVATY